MDATISTEQKARILIVDDDEQIADILTLRLESEGYLVDSCQDIGRALGLLREHRYSLVLLDLRLGDDNGIDALPRFRDIDGAVPIFIITAHGDVDSAVQAFSRGASGFIRKPFQEGNLTLQIAQAVESYQMKLEIQKTRKQGPLGEKFDKLILYRGPVMKRFMEQVRIASGTNSNVVIYGASGTGKELVARALHNMGSRSKGPFVAINCGALPETLLESELFGYVRGAFTDARENKVGHVVRANGGTLFLDEIGDAPLSIQVKLLRVLQERELMPVGGSSAVKVDVRVVVATHRDLKSLVAEGKFREDFFYRLHVLPLNVPPLKARRQDIEYLATVFANRFASELARKVDGFTASAIAAMRAYAWPGNVRELQNRVEHAIVMARGPVITSVDLFPEGVSPDLFDEVQDTVIAPAAACERQDAPAEAAEAEQAEPVRAPEADRSGQTRQPAVPVPNEICTYKEAKEQFEKQYIRNLLRAARGNIAKAARLAGKYRTEVYGLIRKYSLDPREFKR